MSERTTTIQSTVGDRLGPTQIVEAVLLPNKEIAETPDAARVEPRLWTIEETIDISSLLHQRIRFRITHPEASSELASPTLAVSVSTKQSKVANAVFNI